VRPAPGKGLGVFATQLIPRGTPIIIEAPLISVPVPKLVPGQGFRLADMITDIETSFQKLTPEQQEEFLQLHDFRFPSETDQSHLLTIVRSNAYNTGDDQVGLFPKLARINHSCRPNSGNWWSEKEERRIIYAARDIEEGEEITVSYIPLLKTRKERHGRLAQYGFVCGCEACKDGSGDKNRLKIADLLEDLEQKMHSASKKESITKKRIARAMSLVETVEEEGLSDYLARAYHLVSIFNKQGKSFGEAEKWAKKELEILRLAETDSREALAASDFIKDLRKR